MSGFLSQPSAKYRNFQLVFTLLTLNFAIPTISYIFFPEVAHQQFVELNAFLGGAAYSFPEAQSHFWRYLGAANVATLALMCGLLQWNLRRFYAVLVPLTFMKALAATLWLAGFVAAPQYPAFLAAALLDFASSGAFVYFAVRAHRDIEGLTDAQLWPPPSPLRAVNRAAASVALGAVLPGVGPLEPAVRAELDEPNAARLALGFGLASWAVVLGSVFTRFRRPVWRLRRDEADAYVSELAGSRVWLLRQVIEVVKLVAGFAAARR